MVLYDDTSERVCVMPTSDGVNLLVHSDAGHCTSTRAGTKQASQSTALLITRCSDTRPTILQHVATDRQISIHVCCESGQCSLHVTLLGEISNRIPPT